MQEVIFVAEMPELAETKTISVNKKGNEILLL